MQDRLPPKEMCLESRDLFRVWEIGDTISLTVQNTSIVAMEHRYEIVCGLSNGTSDNAIE